MVSHIAYRVCTSANDQTSLNKFTSPSIGKQINEFRHQTNKHDADAPHKSQSNPY